MSKELMEKAVRILDSKKAQDIKVIDISELTTLGDYFIIATGTSSTHVRSLAGELEEQLKKDGYTGTMEGYDNTGWVLMDYKDAIIHVFYGEMREHYQLEHLWSDGTPVDISGLLTQD